jgi:hypothetical protein
VETPITTEIGITVVGDCDAQKVEVWGVFIDLENPPLHLSGFEGPSKLPPLVCEWDEANRTALYRFEGAVTISKIGITVVDPNVRTLIVCFVLDKRTDQVWERLGLPRTKEGAYLVYPVRPVKAAAVVVYYDALPAVVPHRIGFSFSLGELGG